MKRIICIILLVMLMFGCATYRPIVDMRGADQGQYERDLQDCQSYAANVSPAAEAMVGAVIGVGVGAVLGAVVGSFFGQADWGAEMGMAIVGTQGLMAGASGGIQGQVDIIRNCMAGRGYNVLR
jgi:hypothetical protein